MAAVTSIQNELRNLASVSKRHNSELAQSTSRSLSILDAATQSFDNEKLVIQSLRKYEEFTVPFILACSEASAKSCASALQCIQTLATFQGIAESRLPQLIHALMDATQLGLGIQLKILQVLPVILHEFAADLTSKDVIDLLEVCSVLLAGHKVAMVHNAAFATLQQLINGVFDRTDIALSNYKGEDPDSALRTVRIGENEPLMVKPQLYDSLMVMLDLCNIAENIDPEYLRISDLPLTSVLELLELVLSNQADLIHRHDDLASILRTRVTPLLLRVFSEEFEFPVLLRVVRIFYLLLRQHLGILTTESEVVLATLAHGAKQGESWRQVICLEVLQNLLLDIQLLYQIYQNFDAEKNRTDIILNLTKSFADTLSKCDDLVLLPSNSDKSGHTNLVISKDCVPNSPVIDMLDRVEPPKISSLYPFFLVVKCANLLTDDVHKLVSTIEGVDGILDTLSSPLLVCHSASMNLAMDTDLFRLVVRSVQRLAHASGIINKVGPRDEFIGLLAQNCHLSGDEDEISLKNQRCSLCVRALFNLGYALGNQLGQSWDLLTSVIYSLRSDVGENEYSIEDFYTNGARSFRTINVALKKLLESTVHLSDSALIHLTKALGSGNEKSKYKLLEYIVSINALRFSDPSNKCWENFANILLKGIDHPEMASTALDTLNNVSSQVMEISVCKAGDFTAIDSSLKMILQYECAAINSRNSEIRLAASEHLFVLLEKFGAKIYEGWIPVLELIAEVPASNNFDFMHAIFDAVELICSDFLENLPYTQVFNLTLCLDEFSKQTVDINTAFTATSLFWSVCDHLMKNSTSANDLNFESIKNEEDLVRLARDENLCGKQYALWLFAVLKLASIFSEVQQQQAKTSAAQILFRIFNTHGSFLPIGAWEIATLLIFPVLLVGDSASFPDNLPGLLESNVLVINGLTEIIINFYSTLSRVKHFDVFLKKWMNHLKYSVQLSPQISLTVYKDLLEILQADVNETLPRTHISEFWLQQDVRPSFAVQNPRVTADAFTELVRIYPFIKNEISVESSLSILTACAIFPYYTTPAISSGKYEMSSLQHQSCLQLNEIVNKIDQLDCAAQILLALNQISLSPFENKSTSDKANFRGLSLWAQEKLLSALSCFQTPPSHGVSTAITTVVSGTNRVLLNQNFQEVTLDIILKAYEISSDINHFGDSIVSESVRLVLKAANSFDNETTLNPDCDQQIINRISQLLTILKSKSMNQQIWSIILKTILQYSVLYDRSIHNHKLYENFSYEDCKALRFGTVEPARRINHENLSFLCLKILQQMAKENKEYSKVAQNFFESRICCVLNQYVGDCRTLGREPMQHIVKEELLFVLSQLQIWTSERLKLSNELNEVILMSISRAHGDILPMLEKILANIYKRL